MEEKEFYFFKKFVLSIHELLALKSYSNIFFHGFPLPFADSKFYGIVVEQSFNCPQAKTYA